jgi:hypothetical protein
MYIAFPLLKYKRRKIMKRFEKKRRRRLRGGEIDIPKKIKRVVKGFSGIIGVLKLIGRNRLGKDGFQVALFTLIFALATVGLIGLFNGENVGNEQRLGVYVLFSSVLFIITIYYIEKMGKRNAFEVIKVVMAITILGFVLASLSGEGLVRVIRGTEYTLQMYLYLITGGLVCSGVGYWAIRHWKEYT